MMAYPAVFDVAPPERFQRLQLLLRILVMMVLGLIGVSLGWVFLLVYLVLPVTAAIIIESQGAERYLGRTAPAIEQLLRWLLSFQAYMSFLSDRFPTGEGTLVRYDVAPTGRPTPATALWRLLASLPEAIVLVILGLLAGVVWILSAISVLLVERVPRSFLLFMRGLLRWQARLCAYHASLVDVLPPFAIDAGPEAPSTSA